MCAALLALRRPVEKGDVGAGRAAPVGIERVVRADVVLVDGRLDQAQPKRADVEVEIALCRARDGGDVVVPF